MKTEFTNSKDRLNGLTTLTIEHEIAEQINQKAFGIKSQEKNSGKMESVFQELIAEIENNRLNSIENLFKKYENMKEEDDVIVDLRANKIITKKKGVKRLTEKNLERMCYNRKKSAPICPYGTTSKGLKLMGKIECHLKSGGKIYGGRQASSSMEPTFPFPPATRGIKRRAVCQPVRGSPYKRPSSPPSPSISEPSFPEPSIPVPVATRDPEPSPSAEQISPVPVATRGGKRRVELLPVGVSPKRPRIGPRERQTVPLAERVQTRSMTSRGPQPSSSAEKTLPVPLATRGTKRALLESMGGSTKRPKRPQPCPTTIEPTSPGPLAARGKESRCPVSVTARAPALADKKIEAPELLQQSCNRYNLRPRKKLSAIDSPKSRGDKKDHLAKSRRGVQKELPTMEGDLISGSPENYKFMRNDPKICPLTYLADDYSSTLSNVRGVAHKFTRRPPVPQNRRKTFPLDSITLMLM